ncbi:hypothetical protein KGF54_001898 [Candida jiufengensis]|uniref:uncharacterized protein n=1 Tax=Candida jiufengensis TaxID=497108 RepID=UPI0022258138|nr:uncharacterized protein KGF54_001898 [Candida jiufengensis]KAI5955337.1 hypothetical protein KGF54_001898 [Candida jiufengensis]
MSSTTSIASKNEEKSAHLFVLIHGLFGSPNHMNHIEKFITNSLTKSINEKDLVSNDVITTLKPVSFRFWKTYDGLDLNSRKIITEIFYEIESLKDKNNLKVTKISFVGYSLGGLLSRYVIGLLNELNFFDIIKPVFFSTFATPHLGVHFFKNNIFDHIANNVGPYLFGKTGGQLFITDYDKILIDLADPKDKYFQGLLKFEKHILLANIKNDRTVAFFTSYITSYSPFDQLDKIKVKYLKDLPQSRIKNKLVRPKVVDLTRSHLVGPEDSKNFNGNHQEETPFIIRNKFAKILIIIMLACFLLPLWIPFVFTTSIVVSIYSYIKVKIHSIPNITDHWSKVMSYVYNKLPNQHIDPEDAKASEQQRAKRKHLSKHESFKGDTSHITENAMDQMLYAEERFMGRTRRYSSADEDYDDDEEDEIINGNVKVKGKQDYEKGEFEVGDTSIDQQKKDVKSNDKTVTVTLIDIDFELNDKIINEHITRLKDYDNFKLFEPEFELELGKERTFIMNSLNQIDWIKLPVYLDVFNSHDNIVSRGNLNVKSCATMGVWLSILRNHLKDDYRNSIIEEDTIIDI